MIFLSGLDDATHGIVRSQICAMSPLSDLDSVYQTFSQNEIIHSTVVPNTQSWDLLLKLDLQTTLGCLILTERRFDQQIKIHLDNVRFVAEQGMRLQGVSQS